MAFVTIVRFPLPFPEAGLVSPECPEQLLIALEPEAASIYCRKLRLHQVIDLSLQPIMNGLDLDGARPFDSGFRQGSEGWRGRESGLRLFDGCFLLLSSVPGNCCGVAALGGGYSCYICFQASRAATNNSSHSDTHTHARRAFKHTHTRHRIW